jgi:aryl-alcohol dehydrogenase
MKIQAAVSGPEAGDFKVEEVELEDPRNDEVLVRVMATGLCHTDVVAQQGAFGFSIPAVLGHEGAGIVVKVGKTVAKVAPGDRVAMSFRSCGECAKCQSGHPAYCHKMPLLNYAGMRPDGSRSISRLGQPIASNFFGQSSFASYALTYERNLVKIPADLAMEIAAPLGCGIQTGAGSVINSFRCEAGSSLLVVGGGSVGLSAVMGGLIQKCGTIIVVEPIAARRQAASEFGATHVIDPQIQTDLSATVRAICPLGVDYALDTTGRADVLEAIMNALAPQGTLGCVGIPKPGTQLPGDLTRLLTYGHKVMGIIEGDSDPEIFIPQMIEYHRAGRMPFDRMITTYPLAMINQAIADQHAGKCIKAVFILMNERPLC